MCNFIHSNQSCARQGFSLVEILVVIAIIGLLLSVAVSRYQRSVGIALDSERQQTTQQLAQVLKVYQTVVGALPVCPGGATLSKNGDVVSVTASGVCPDASAIETFLQDNLKADVADPLNDPNRYFYFYDSNLSCGSESYAVVFSHMEYTANSNASDVCPQTNQTDGSYSGYDTGDPSKPYVVLIGAARS